MVALGDDRQGLIVVIFVAVEPQTVLTYELRRNFIYGHIVTKLHKALEVKRIVFGSLRRTTTFYFQVLNKIQDKF